MNLTEKQIEILAVALLEDMKNENRKESANDNKAEHP